MEDEVRIPIFRGDGFEDSVQHWFLCEAIWNINNVIDEAVRRTSLVLPFKIAHYLVHEDCPRTCTT
jgi:hypothetical protein